MLITIRRKLSTTIESQEIRRALLALPQKRWEPAIIGQQRFFFDLGGVDTSDADELLLRTRLRAHYRHEVVGDIFFKDRLILYIVAGSPDGALYTDEFGRVIRVGGDDNDKLEVGVIGTDRAAAKEELEALAQDFEFAIKATLDGRKTRHMDFDWTDVVPEKRRLEKITSNEDEDVSFHDASLDTKTVEAALTLADPETRAFSVLISETVFLRQQEAFARKRKKKNEAEKIIHSLQEAGVINTEYLLECRRSGTRLSRFSSPDEIEDDKIGSLVCASCGKAFKDELLTEGYSLSGLGRDLIQSSHWMTVWVSHLLVELGVDEGNIIWNVSESGEEIDIIVEFLGQLWIFELKDREFGAGDAHPFNYRRVKYGADQAIIVTTDKVSKDAKRVFDELAREDPIRYRRRIKIVYAEGFDNAREVLKKVISEAALDYARQRLSKLGDLAGYDFDAMLKAKYQ